MGCAPGKDCCDDCRQAKPVAYRPQRLTSSAATPGAALSASVHAIVNAAEGAVKNSGECGAYGSVEDVFVSVFGDSSTSSSSAECQAYQGMLANLRLWEGQLNDAIDRADLARAERIATDIEDVAGSLVSTADISNFHNAFVAWGQAIGQAAGDVVSGAIDTAGAAVKGAASSLGFFKVALLVAVAVVIVNPGILARAAK